MDPTESKLLSDNAGEAVQIESATSPLTIEPSTTPSSASPRVAIHLDTGDTKGENGDSKVVDDPIARKAKGPSLDASYGQ